MIPVQSTMIAIALNGSTLNNSALPIISSYFPTAYAPAMKMATPMACVHNHEYQPQALKHVAFNRFTKIARLMPMDMRWANCLMFIAFKHRANNPISLVLFHTKWVSRVPVYFCSRQWFGTLPCIAHLRDIVGLNIVFVVFKFWIWLPTAICTEPNNGYQSTAASGSWCVDWLQWKGFVLFRQVCWAKRTYIWCLDWVDDNSCLSLVSPEIKNRCLQVQWLCPKLTDDAICGTMGLGTR